jgi:hypothetical protein
VITVDLSTLGFTVIFLRGCSKYPESRHGRHWTSNNPEEIRRHRANVGLTAGPFAVLDFDRMDAMDEMMRDLGRLQPTVETGSGKIHCYVQSLPNLPRQFFWRDTKVGEIARLTTEYVVCPPSIHPETARQYRWLVDPREPFPQLPSAWQEHLLRGRPAAKVDDLGDPPAWMLGADFDRTDFADMAIWSGPPADELLERALRQPGAKRRGDGGVKFQCPACRAEGHDKHRDNAKVFADGRWGCAFDSAHGRAIATALGVVEPSPVAGYDVGMLRRLGLRL